MSSIVSFIAGSAAIADEDAVAGVVVDCPSDFSDAAAAGGEWESSYVVFAVCASASRAALYAPFAPLTAKTEDISLLSRLISLFAALMALCIAATTFGVVPLKPSTIALETFVIADVMPAEFPSMPCIKP